MFKGFLQNPFANSGFGDSGSIYYILRTFHVCVKMMLMGTVIGSFVKLKEGISLI